jgi:hypothetical protein
MTETATVSYTAPIVIPEAGRLYRYDSHRNTSDRELIFVTQATASTSDHTTPDGRPYTYGVWNVEGYRVTLGATLTDEPVSLHGEIGTPYGTRQLAWCRRIGSDAGDLFQPVFSRNPGDLFGASSQQEKIEAEGRARYMA